MSGLAEQPVLTATRRPPPAARREAWAARMRRALLVSGWLSAVALLAGLFLYQARSLSLWGMVEARTVPVAHLQGGRVASVLVAVGARVEQGQVLAEIDGSEIDRSIARLEREQVLADDEYAARCAEQNARLTAALADLAADRLSAQIDAMHDEQGLLEVRARTAAAIAEAESALARLQRDHHVVAAELAVVEVEVARRQQMVAQQIIAQSEVDKMQPRLAELRTRLADAPGEVAAQDGVIAQLRTSAHELELHAARPRPAVNELSRTEELERSVHSTAADLAQRQHAGDRERRNSELAELRLRRAACAVRSPVSGIVAALPQPVGAVVPAGSSLADIVPLAQRRAIAYVSEAQARLVAVGAEVSLQPAGIGRQAVPGRVTAVGAAVDTVPGTVRVHYTSADRGLPVLIDLPADAALLPGERVEIRFAGADWLSSIHW